jgi:tryptophan synthase alpha chain
MVDGWPHPPHIVPSTLKIHPSIRQTILMPLSFERKPSLVAYLTCGDPNLATTRDIVLAAIDAGAAIIELGVPFSDPLADGPVIQRASERLSSVGVIVFTYFNPVLRMGLETFAAGVADAGIDGALITDLPVEEAGTYLQQMRQRNLVTVFLAAPTSSEARLKRIVQASSGFVYAVSRAGVTGARKQLTDDAEKLVGRLRRHSPLPIAVGFGISTAEQFAAVGKFADAAVIGSAIVETIERNPGKEPESVAQFIEQLLVVRRHSPVASP